jgi:PKD repeat protein
MKRTLTLSLLFLFFQASLIAQSLQYLAYEGFNYPNGLALNQLSGGSGWNGRWNVQNNNADIPGYQTSSNALSFGDIQVSGGIAAGGSSYLTAGRLFDLSTGGPFANYIQGGQIGSQTGTDLWVSALLSKTIGNAQPLFFSLHNNNLAWCDGCTTSKISFGYYGTSSDVNGSPRWTLRLGNNLYTLDSVVNPQAPVFVVLHIVFNTNSLTTIEAYINPSQLGTNGPPTQPDIVQTIAGNFTFQSLALYLGEQPNQGAIDEFRIGDSYPIVAPNAGVVLDLPPVSVLTSNVASGQAPLMVDFYSTGSYDPEGSAIQYRWHFGDGTPDVLNQTLASHSYFQPGTYPASLTVTDTSGQSVTAYLDIVVYDQNGAFPCQTTVSSINHASCGLADGAFRVNANGETFHLFDTAGTEFTATNTDFTNLHSGNYYLYLNGANGCADTMNLTILVDSSTCEGWQPSDCALKIGFNVASTPYWSTNRAFRNLFKQHGAELITYTQNCNCWNTGEYLELAVDSNGYPLEIPQTLSSGLTYVRFVLSSGGATLQNGQTYLLLYDGEGTIQLQGGLVLLSQSPGRIEFQANGNGNQWMHLTASTLGNPLRNIRIVRPVDEFTDLEANPFYQPFLNHLAPFSALRFMDWGGTNFSPLVHWEERVTPSFRTYATDLGVPFEVMIQLANTLHQDVWVCVPHRADDDFVVQMARLFRDRLNDSLNVYLEYSNEVWNWQFEQAHYNDDNRPDNLNYGRAYAEKARRVFRIWKNEFGAENHRVKRVLGLQGGYNYLNEHILAQLSSNEWDFASPTWYFGLNHDTVATGNPLLNVNSTPADIIANSTNSWRENLAPRRQDCRTVQLFGKRIISYEGGQHFTDFQLHSYQQAMYDAQTIPAMYDLYNEVLDSFRYWGTELAMAFVDVGEHESVYGSWGHLEDVDQLPPYTVSAPRFQVLLDNQPINCSEDITVGQNAFVSKTISLYPNPNSGDFWISIADENKSTKISVSDMFGRFIYSSAPKAKNSQISLPVDIASGFYTLRMESGSQIQVTKFVVFK